MRSIDPAQGVVSSATDQAADAENVITLLCLGMSYTTGKVCQANGSWAGKIGKRLPIATKNASHGPLVAWRRASELDLKGPAWRCHLVPRTLGVQGTVP